MYFNVFLIVNLTIDESLTGPMSWNATQRVYSPVKRLYCAADKIKF